MPVYTRDQLITFGVRCLEAMGTRQEYGRIIAEAAADTEAMGVTTHGMATYPYFDAVIPDKLDPAVQCPRWSGMQGLPLW